MAEKETGKRNALDNSAWRATRGVLLWMLQVVVYPFHAVVHLVLVHLAPLIFMSIMLVAAPVLVFFAWLGVHQSLPEQVKSVAAIVEFTTLIGLLGIIPMLVGRLWGHLAKAGKDTLGELSTLIAGPWLPNFSLPESFTDTAELRQQRSAATRVGLRGATRLFLALALVALVAILVRATVLPRDGVETQLKELTTRLDAYGDPRAPLLIAVSDLRLALKGAPPASAEVTARLGSLRAQISTLVAELQNVGGDTGSGAEHPLLAAINVHLINLENALGRDAPQVDEIDTILATMLIEVSRASVATPGVQGDGSIETMLMHILVELQSLRGAILGLQAPERPTTPRPLEQPAASQGNNAPDNDRPRKRGSPDTHSATGPKETDSPEVDGRGDVVPEIIAFPDGVVFSVTHLVDGQLDARRTGICLDEAQVDWLSAFKQAIAECSADKAEPLELEVLGYSSIAPALGPDQTDAESVRWNRRIADERGAVVQRFLLLEDGQDFSAEACAKGMNKDMTPYVDARVNTTTNYKVSYTPWSGRENEASYPVPVDDGNYPGIRRFASELLNRSAHIVIKNDVCFLGSTRTLASDGGA